MSTVHERYRVTVQPGKNAEAAAARLARLVVQRWMPGNGGGVHVFCTPNLAALLIQFFQREKSTTIEIDTDGITPVITEIP